MSKWFEIRNAPKPEGIVIAIWHRENKNLRLSHGAKDVVYSSTDDDDIRTYARWGEEAKAIQRSLVKEITEADFSVLQEIADIPQIISDGMLHHLGTLSWEYETPGSNTGDKTLGCSGVVYTKVIAIDGVGMYDSSLSMATITSEHR